MNDEMKGWQRDPFGIHDFRFFSDDGKATFLVCNGTTKSYDRLPHQLHSATTSASVGVSNPAATPTVTANPVVHTIERSRSEFPLTLTAHRQAIEHSRWLDPFHTAAPVSTQRLVALGGWWRLRCASWGRLGSTEVLRQRYRQQPPVRRRLASFKGHMQGRPTLPELHPLPRKPEPIQRLPPIIFLAAKAGREWTGPEAASGG